MTRNIRITVQVDGDEASVSEVIWKTQDDDCTTTKRYPTLYEALRAARRTGEPFALFDGHHWFIDGVTRCQDAEAA